MDPESWRRVEVAFHDALDRLPGERAAFLEAQLGDAPALRAEVERLLALDAQAPTTHDPAGDLVQRFAVLPPREPRRDPLVGSTIGVHRLESVLGVGGMGVVYRGVRADGLFEQEVAVKLVRAEAASPEALARFDVERRTLAALNHPNVAHLYGGGTTENGTPYLVMELVHGPPIDRWCDEQALPVDERLRLFASACRAVHFAHQNLIVHGDLKPANVLVDARGAVKLLDFGIARLLEPGEGARLPDVTRTLARMLTPEYASPEQLRGEPLTTAADVYSLGVLLHVLVAGDKPFRSEGLTPGQWERLVTEKEPPRPSTVVRDPDWAARLRTTPARLARALRGDVDRIVAMALRKEPGRRYASALQLAEDVERHLQGLPVQARSDTLAYRTWTFTRRHRVVVGAALSALAALVVGLVLALAAERRAVREARHARIEADSFRQIADITLAALLPLLPAGGEARQQVRQHLVLQAEQVRREHADAAHLRANLLDALGLVLLDLGAAEDGESLLREALAIREGEFGPRNLEVALSLRSLSVLHERRGELPAAAAALERALSLHRELHGVHTDVASAAHDLGCVLQRLGRLDEAERLLEEALALRRAAVPGSLDLAETLVAVAALAAAQGRDDRASSLLAEALALRERILGADHPLALETRALLSGQRPRP